MKKSFPKSKHLQNMTAILLVPAVLLSLAVPFDVLAEEIARQHLMRFILIFIKK